MWLKIRGKYSSNVTFEKLICSLLYFLVNPEAARLQMAESRIMDMESQIETGPQIGKQHALKKNLVIPWYYLAVLFKLVVGISATMCHSAEKIPAKEG